MKTIIITGASDGIGAAAARMLTEKGHQVVVVGRSPDKTRAIAEQLGVPYHLADYSDLDQVARLADELLAAYPRIDVLAHNAGGSFDRERGETADGFELTFQVNYLAGWYLTWLLLPRLLESQALVINTSSLNHRWFSNFDLADLQNTRNYSGLGAYSNSKLAQILHVHELQRRFGDQGLSAVSFHPGMVGTNLGNSANTISGRFLRNKWINRWLRTSEQGADTLVWLADGEPGVNYPVARYFGNRSVQPTARKATDPTLARQLWERTGALLADRLPPDRKAPTMQIADAPPAIAAWVSADRRQDLAQMRAQLAADVVLVSPLTDAFDFRGPAEVMAVFESAFELLADIEIANVTGSGRHWVLHGTNTLQRRNFEEIQWLELDDAGLIAKITLFIRPVPAAVALLARIGVPLHRRGAMNRLGAVASALAAPLAAALQLTEKTLMRRLKR